MDKIYCPAFAEDCPYYKDGYCTIENPFEECDDFYSIVGDQDYDDVDETNYNPFTGQDEYETEWF